jgi:integrase
MRGMGRTFLRGETWWIQYSVLGVKHRESSGSKKKADAVALLKRRHEEAGKGRPAPVAEKVTLADLKALLDNDYARNGRRSKGRLDQAWEHVTGFFGPREKAVSVTALRVERYLEARTGEGAAPATVRLEIAALRRGFNLARKTGTLLANECPAAWPTIAPDNRRKGFFEDRDLDKVISHLPADHADLIEFLRWSGWRRGEAQGLRWSDVDESARVIRIETTKSGEPRTLPYGALPVLADLIDRRRRVTDDVKKRRRMVVTHVFHKNGKPIGSFRKSWITACVEAGLGREVREPDKVDAKGKIIKRGRLIKKEAFRIPHDLRRSAARNMSRAGVPEQVIMQICGWRTRSVFDRYRITSERDLADGLARLAATSGKVKASS